MRIRLASLLVCLAAASFSFAQSSESGPGDRPRQSRPEFKAVPDGMPNPASWPGNYGTASLTSVPAATVPEEERQVRLFLDRARLCSDPSAECTCAVSWEVSWFPDSSHPNPGNPASASQLVVQYRIECPKADSLEVYAFSDQKALKIYLSRKESPWAEIGKQEFPQVYFDCGDFAGRLWNMVKNGHQARQ